MQTNLQSPSKRYDTAQECVLRAEHLSLSWDGLHTILQDINIYINIGETVCMVGRSGCGKTTLLHALSGLMMPDQGRVFVHNKDISGTPGHVSYMFQKDLLIASKKIIDNICLPLTLRGMSKQEARQQALPLLERFGLASTAYLWPAELSGGMRQRVAFLRTYLMGADIMLLDEPFSALDALTRKDLRQWFLDMSREMHVASLMITHDVDEAVAMAERIYVLGGAPQEGCPSYIAGEVRVSKQAGQTSDAFELTPAFLETKRRVLGLLG